MQFFIFARSLLLALFLCFFFLVEEAFCFIRDFVESVKIVNVNSVKQKIVDFDKIVLEEKVDVFIDEKIHIWADYVEIDRKNQYLKAKKNGDGALIIENDSFLFLADSFFLNLDNKTGYADNMRIHVSEGYVFAKKAEKLEDGSWKMEDITFTPCDHAVAHWSIAARKAKLKKNYLIKISGAAFKLGEVPVFVVPYMILPVQNRSASGFLLPRIAFDDDLGLGFRQEFYWSIAPKCDSTVGFDWRDRKGISFVGEFRWARSPESFTIFNGQYALEKNAFVKKKDRIILGTDRKYWIGGNDFRSFKYFFGREVDSLIRVDFGTDKKIGYQFFEDFSHLDNTFYNSWILRFVENYGIFNGICDSRQTKRSKFLEPTLEEKKELFSVLPLDFRQKNKQEDLSFKKEIEDRVTIALTPHFEWNGFFKKINKQIFFRHDIFVDHILSRGKKIEKIYFGSGVLENGVATDLSKADTFRFLYNANIQKNLKFLGQNFIFNICPNFQLRSNLLDRSQRAKKNVLEGHLFDSGSCRLFLQGGVDWVFPEFIFKNFNQKNSHHFHPVLSWNFLPKFKQDHWYYSDRWDRFYPKNQISLELKNSWFVDNVCFDLDLCQSYDFYSSFDRFQLERNPNQKHLLPLDIKLNLNCDVLDLFFNQKYDWKNFQLLHSEWALSFSLKDFNINLATVYQDKKFQESRELLSDIPHFLLLSASFPLMKNAILSYEGQFYSEKISKIFPFQSPKALIHAIKLKYEGHCWGVAVGFEEKSYRQYGNWKNEQAFTLFIKLESIGSFAKKFRQPQPLASFSSNIKGE